MELVDERTAFMNISETLAKAGVSLFNAVKYVYMAADRDFYNINVKDIFKIALSDITDTTALYNTGIRLDKERCAEMNSPEYERILSLMVYSFAVRLPLLRNIKTLGGHLNDKQIRAVYDMVIAKGASNFENVITEEYDDFRRMARMGRKIPPYDAEWFKGYIYSYVPALSAINNRNLFLLGSVDVLFTLFYGCLEEKLEDLVHSFVQTK